MDKKDTKSSTIVKAIIIIFIFIIFILCFLVSNYIDNIKNDNSITNTDYIDFSNGDYVIDFEDENDFEKELNNGNTEVQNKIVRFVVKRYEPKSTFGDNCIAGEHLNFISSKKTDANVDDIIIGIITSNPKNFLGSWIINYKLISKTSGTTVEDKSEENNSQEEEENNPKTIVNKADEKGNILEENNIQKEDKGNQNIDTNKKAEERISEKNSIKNDYVENPKMLSQFTKLGYSEEVSQEFVNILSNLGVTNIIRIRERDYGEEKPTNKEIPKEGEYDTLYYCDGDMEHDVCGFLVFIKQDEIICVSHYSTFEDSSWYKDSEVYYTNTEGMIRKIIGGGNIMLDISHQSNN